MNLQNLPECVLEEILGYFTYNEIAKYRLVIRQCFFYMYACIINFLSSLQISTLFDKICQDMLNRGFYKMIRKHAIKLKEIKSLLPRRESERRNHPLSKHIDVLTCVETRLSMLSQTYSKYINFKLCCFIPGKVIDEIIGILKFISTTPYTEKSVNSPSPMVLRTHEVLQELRDISSMAIEHFEENIAVLLKKTFFEIHQIKQTSKS